MTLILIFRLKCISKHLISCVYLLLDHFCFPSIQSSRYSYVGYSKLVFLTWVCSDIAVLVLVFNAAKCCPTMPALFSDHTFRHYAYLRDSLSHLVPHLRVRTLPRTSYTAFHFYLRIIYTTVHFNSCFWKKSILFSSMMH